METTDIKIPAYRRFIILPAQVVLVLIGKLLIRPLTRRTLPPELRRVSRRPHIIIANHKKALDPLTIISALPLGTIFRLAPVASIMHNFFYDSALRPLVWLIGCFPAKNPRGKHRIFGVDGSVAFLRGGYSFFIFPEGTRVRQERGPARPGIIRIHKALPHVPFILCHISYPKGLKNRLTGRWRTVSYKLVEKPDYSESEKMMDDVFAL